ncbi:hypothetical protein KL931_000375 [Ogataea haglerorum]|nr:hypothetical protein KL931_000375 [Ogataea haglerorum]
MNANEVRNKIEPKVHSNANLRGLSDNKGSRTRQRPATTKTPAAPRRRAELCPTKKTCRKYILEAFIFGGHSPILSIYSSPHDGQIYQTFRGPSAPRSANLPVHGHCSWGDDVVLDAVPGQARLETLGRAARALVGKSYHSKNTVFIICLARIIAVLIAYLSHIDQ